MKTTKLVSVPDAVTPDNLTDVMDQAIQLELATIPTYLSTYYSIHRSQDQDALYEKLQSQLTNAANGKSPAEINALAQELKLDILTYSNKSAALTMSVVIEEMLHMSLACNVKTAVCQEYPDLLKIGEGFKFPAELDGHKPEFIINGAKLSLNQLTTFLQIESPAPFVDPGVTPNQKHSVVDYQTIGGLYKMIEECIKVNFPGPYKYRPQLLPPEKDKPEKKRPFYNQNSMNTMYFDRDHNPHFASDDDSGVLVHVHNAKSAIKAIDEIVEQGEGNAQVGVKQHLLEWDDKGMPVPLQIIDGEAIFYPGDYDDEEGKELSHFAKFLEAYSFGLHYQEKFKQIEGLQNFFEYFVYNTKSNVSQADYDALTSQQCANPQALSLANQVANATFSYLLLMIESCYHNDEHTQFDLFMYGIHKSMIWLLSGVGNQIHSYNYEIDCTSYQGSISWEPYAFNTDHSAKSQLLDLVNQLAMADPVGWGWATNSEYDSYFQALPDVGYDYHVKKNVPEVPKS